MIKLPRDFGRKVFKGFDIVAHLNEFMDLSEYVKMSWLILLGGTVVSVGLRLLGVWMVIDHYVATLTPHSGLMFNSQMFFLGALPFFVLPRLAQELFMSRAKNAKSHEPYWRYFLRYVKGMCALVIGPLGLLMGIVAGVGVVIFNPFMSLLAGPKTAVNALMLGGLGFVGLCLIATYIVGNVLAFALSSYSFAFVLQGVALQDAVVRGVKLFYTQWLYPVVLSLPFIVLPILVRFLLPLMVDMNANAFLQNGLVADMGMCIAQHLSLVYYTLFLAYHKRVSKIPTSR